MNTSSIPEMLYYHQGMIDTKIYDITTKARSTLREVMV